MSNEKKRDVFETIADKYAGYDDELYEKLLRKYDDALPDDMPVIPKAVEEYIKRQTDSLPDLKVESWIIDHGDAFTRAWLLGVWCVEETGGIVKLGAEK